MTEDNSYIIGESNHSEMLKAIDLDICQQIRPKVSHTMNQNFYAMERYCMLLIQEVVRRSGNGIVDRVGDSCKADITFILSANDDKCLACQIKTTKCVVNRTSNYNFTYPSWTFTIKKTDYSGMLLILRSIEDGKTWMIPYNDYAKKYNGDSIVIGTSDNLFFNKYRVETDEIPFKLLEFYRSMDKGSLTHFSRKEVNIPPTPNQRLERVNRAKIQTLLKGLNLSIKESFLENDTYDFKLGELKVQEKTGRVGSDYGTSQGIVAHFTHKVTRVPYSPEDLDILIVHMPNIYDDIFYFIPKQALRQRGYFKTVNCIGNTNICVYPGNTRDVIRNRTQNNWANDFMFSYSDIDVLNKLTQIYSDIISTPANTVYDDTSYSVGQSPDAGMLLAITQELDLGIRPILGDIRKRKVSIACVKYARLLINELVKRSRLGNVESVDDCDDYNLTFSAGDEYSMACQVKITINSTGPPGREVWQFTQFNKDYSGSLMIFRVMSNGRTWIVPYDILRQTYRGVNLRITCASQNTNFNWKEYEVHDNNIAERLFSYYCTIKST